MSQIPTKIYLQIGCELSEIEDFDELTRDGSVSWCADKVEDTDIAYLREESVMEVFRWLLGYYDFPINDGAKSPYYWRPLLCNKMKEMGIEFKPPAK